MRIVREVPSISKSKALQIGCLKKNFTMNETSNEQEVSQNLWVSFTHFLPVHQQWWANTSPQGGVESKQLSAKLVPETDWKQKLLSVHDCYMQFFPKRNFLDSFLPPLSPVLIKTYLKHARVLSWEKLGQAGWSQIFPVLRPFFTALAPSTSVPHTAQHPK